MSKPPKSLIIMENSRLNEVYGPRQIEAIKELTELISEPITKEDIKKNPSILNDVEIIFGSWGMPLLTSEVLDEAPNLKAVFYGAGTVKSFATSEFFERRIPLSNASVPNGIPVAEYCLATILFSLKLGWRHSRRFYSDRIWKQERDAIIGAYESTVGLISLGAIGYKTLELLKPFNLNILVNSRSLTPDKAEALGVETVALKEIFEKSDVVSLHTPALPSTRHMIKPSHFRLMKPNATFINTARGEVVDQEGMIEVLRERPDLTAVLDVTDPEPPAPGEAISTVQNIVLTPHIAGSIGNECRRLGQTAVDECERFLKGEQLLYPVTEEDLVSMA